MRRLPGMWRVVQNLFGSGAISPQLGNRQPTKLGTTTEAARARRNWAFRAKRTCAIRLRIKDQNGKTVDAGCAVLVAASSGLGVPAPLSRT
jgi:hypothetical protein